MGLDLSMGEEVGTLVLWDHSFVNRSRNRLVGELRFHVKQVSPETERKSCLMVGMGKRLEVARF